MKTILVTGSAGFIGFHVAKRLLEKGNKIIGVDDFNDYYDVSLKEDRNRILEKFEQFSSFRNNIADSESLEKIFKSHPIDSICHLAAQAGVRYSITNPFIYEEVNIKGFLNILELARKYSIKNIIYASSSSVYGNNLMSESGFSEEEEVNQPISIYGVTKRADELLAYSYHNLYKINMTGLRFFTVYGPWGRPDMAYFSFTDAIRKGKKIEVYNEGKMQRDFTYIDDIAEGVISGIDKGYPYEIFNLGNSHTILLIEFINIIEKELGIKANIDFKPIQPGDLQNTHANIAKARKMLNFDPKVDIHEGMSKFIKWYKEYYKK